MLECASASEEAEVALREQSARESCHRRDLLVLFVLPLLVTFWLYWPTLSQPYFWDDIVHFPYVMPRSVLELWTNAEGVAAYYRPIASTLYKTLITLQPPGSTVASHVVVLILHSVNASLTGCLTLSLLIPKSKKIRPARPILGMRASNAAALTAAVLFACYPYAALPVAHVAAIMHPLVTLFMLGTTLAALRFARSAHVTWLVVAIGLAALAPFAHELGIMTGAVALLVVVLDDWSSARRIWRSLLALPLASALFLPIWLLVPKNVNPFEWLGFGGLLASVTFFTQGLTFPLQPISRLLINWIPQLNPSPLVSFVGLPWWVIVAMWSVALLALAAATLALLSHRSWRILGIAASWSLLVALPSIAMLAFPYITVSQRLLYAIAPAAAMLWAVACISLASRVRQPILRGMTALMLVACIVTVPILYIQREMALHRLALEPLKQLAAIGRDYPTDRHLVINAVNWVSYRRPWYALGHEGVSVSAPYIDPATLVWLNARTAAQFDTASVPSLNSERSLYSYSTIGADEPWDWADVAALSPEYDRIWITDYGDQAISIQEAGSVRPGTDRPPVDYLASFGEGVFLTDADAQMEGLGLTTSLHWKVLDGIADATIFRHVYSCDGQMIAQGDGFALGRTLRLELLPPGSEVRDIRHIPVSQLSPEDCTIFGVGLYLPDGTRVPARGPDGSALENDIVILRTAPDPRQ